MTREEKEKAINALKMSVPIYAMTQEEFKDYKQTLNKVMDWLEQEPTTKNDLGVDCISRKSIKQKLQEHHDFFVNAYGGFSNLPQNDKSRVDEITNCIAMVVNEPPVTPQEPILDKIFCIVHPLSIMSTPELEHKAIMQIAEMLESLCLSESEE